MATHYSQIFLYSRYNREPLLCVLIRPEGFLYLWQGVMLYSV